jgi:Ca-activated chloride channel family protein
VVYLVIDRSGSMGAQLLDPELGRKRSRMELAVESADLLANRMQDKDRLALVLYDSSVRYAKLTPPGRPLAMTDEGKEQLRAALAREVPKGGTAMRDAIARAWADACEAIKTNPQDRAIRVLVVLTDGIDNASAISDAQLIQQIGYAQADGRGGYQG